MGSAFLVPPGDGTYRRDFGVDNTIVSQGGNSEGRNNSVGLRGFVVTKVGSESTKQYTLDAIDGLEVGDVYSVRLSNHRYNYGKITSISGNVVTVDPFFKSDMLADGVNWFAIAAKPGIGTIDIGVYAHAEGFSSQAVDAFSHVEGFECCAYGEYSHAEGYNTKANWASHAEGYITNAYGPSSHTEGKSTIAYSTAAHAEGYNTKAGKEDGTGDAAHAEGVSTKATNYAAHAEGNTTTASGEGSHSEGKLSVASGLASHAEGMSKASASYAHAEGYDTEATAWTAHAEGSGTTASGEEAHAEGNGTTASGAASHAEGFRSSALKQGDHAEGGDTAASGGRSHAEGSETNATAWTAHAEGNGTTASAEAAHAEGKKTVSSALASHAGGNLSKATATGAFVHALSSTASTAWQTVFGKYAKETTSPLVVGWGTSDEDRKNIFEVKEDGSVHTMGAFTVGDNNDKVLSTADIYKDVSNSGSGEGLTIPGLYVFFNIYSSPVFVSLTRSRVGELPSGESTVVAKCTDFTSDTTITTITVKVSNGTWSIWTNSKSGSTLSPGTIGTYYRLILPYE